MAVDKTCGQLPIFCHYNVSQKLKKKKPKHPYLLQMVNTTFSYK